MKYFLSSCLLLLFISCSVKSVPLKNNYPTPPIIYISDSKIDQVWSNLIDFISTTGMSIKIIDKSSGLLITEDYSFLERVSYEDQKTHIIHKPEAYLVSNWFRSTQGQPIIPTKLLANWNIRLKETDKGTSVAVNITNVRAEAGQFPYSFDVRSTGVFEKLIFDKVK